MKILNLTSACIVAGILASSALAVETNQETIYVKKCSECHGMNGEGNPVKKGPSLDHQSIIDLNITILDLQGELSINGSSSGEHIDMEHNIRAFEKEGYIIRPLDMSKFIYNSFNPEAKK
ncbi:MAG: cytochrome c [Arcobacteraceae bacterium]|nr:cytochrome c [Arcobacteraceae bacterium]